MAACLESGHMWAPRADGDRLMQKVDVELVEALEVAETEAARRCVREAPFGDKGQRSQEDNSIPVRLQGKGKFSLHTFDHLVESSQVRREHR